MALGDPYATVAEVKSDLGITDTVDDSRLGVTVGAASAWVQQWCGRDFAKSDTATARTFTANHAGYVDVDDFWSTTGLVIGTDDDDDGDIDTTWTLGTHFELRPVDGYHDGIAGWPYTQVASLGLLSFPVYGFRSGRVSVTAKWGWAAVPSSVNLATRLIAARWLKRKDSPEGVLGGFGDFGPVRVGTRLDPDVDLMLRPYRVSTGIN